MKLPTKETWQRAYNDDKDCSLIMRMLQNPGLIKKENLEKIHHTFRGPMRTSNIILEDGLLILKERISTQGNYVKIQIVPAELQNIIFIAFHSNPIGGHFSVYHTLHKIRLRYYWPGMYQYIKKMIEACPGCRMTNATIKRFSELVYSFPVDEPMKVVHADVYTVGAEMGFSGEKHFMFIVCGMCTFAMWEPLRICNSTTFADAIMKILTSFGFAHTIVIDKDSKFLSVFKQTMELLMINLHTASGGHHDPILTERLFRYQNKALRIIHNSLGTNKSSRQSMALTTYAYNSAPVTGTDISRSLIVTGREFHFPIDYASEDHVNLTFNSSSVQNFATEQKKLLTCSREIFKVLITESRSWHREYINSQRPDPMIFNIGDIVLARREVKSSRKHGRVGKIAYKFIGPWKVTEKLHGGSYAIQHCIKSSRTDKKHASHLTPLPDKLIPFPPLHGADTAYQQLHKKYKSNPFAEASIKGYEPSTPGTESGTNVANLIILENDDFHFPTFQEFNDELHTNPHLDTSEVLDTSTSINTFVMTDHHDIHSPIPSLYGTSKSLTKLLANLIKSEDKILFINHEHNNRREWNLIQVDLQQTLEKNPDVVSNGKFLVEYFVSHPHDSNYSSINQRFWREYHNRLGVYQLHEKFNLIQPSIDEKSYCRKKSLVPYSRWTNLNTSDILLHGPFDFTIVNGRKSKDRISQRDFEALEKKKDTYDNEPPSILIGVSSFHIDTPMHSMHISTSISQRILCLNAESYLNHR